MVDFNIYDNAFEAEIERIKRSASMSSSGGRRRNSKANERRGTGTGTGTTFYYTRLNKKRHDTAILGSDGQEEVGEQGQRLWSGTGKGDDDNVDGAGDTPRSLWQPRGEAGKEGTSGFADVVARAMEGAKEVVVGGVALEGEGKDGEGGGQ